MPTALGGLRILDLSRLLPGPFATQILADFGADVIKVEEPGRGDYLRGFQPLVRGESVFFLNLNRNKRSLALNLKSPEGRKVFLSLVPQADVVIESFRPGAMARLGLGYSALRQINPRLVYCALTGYGQDGPLADRAGHDVNYLGLSGCLALLKDPAGTPVIPGFQIADIGGGALTACLGILLALLARERTGVGQLVDAAMVDALAGWLVYPRSLRAAESGPAPYLSGEYPCYAVYRCEDGRFLAVGALEAEFWERLCRTLGRPEWIPLQFSQGPARDRLFDDLRSLLGARTRDEWVGVLGPADCCVTPVLEIDELEGHPHWQARSLLRRFADPERGENTLPAPAVRLSHTPGTLRSPPPSLGQHTDDILRETGYSEQRCAELRACGAVA